MRSSLSSCLGPHGKALFRHKCEMQSWRRLWFAAAVVMAILMLLYSSGSDLSRPWRTGANTEEPPTATEQDDSEYYAPYPHHYGLIIDEALRCQQGAPFLVLVVPVAPGDRTSRDAIRRTWGGLESARGLGVQHYFLLGSVVEGNGTGLNHSVQQQVFEESHLHHDIIQSDFVDSYRNLTVKTMVMFEWLRSHCPNSSYAMKVDSDVFLNVPKLVDLLSAAPRRSYMAGSVQRYSVVQRSTKSKWYLPYSVYPGSLFPLYALGLGYAFSLDLPERILEVSARVRAVYIEDVYVGLCLRELGVEPYDASSLFRAGLPFLMSRCYWTGVITTIMANSEQLLETWKKYQTQLGYC